MGHITDVNGVGELAIGIDWEFGTRSNGPRSASWDVDVQRAVDATGIWKAGYDEDYEVRQAGTIPLKDGYDAVCNLIDLCKPMHPDYTDSSGCDHDYDEECDCDSCYDGYTQMWGMHIHLNVEDERWPSMDISCLFDTYIEQYQKDAIEMIAGAKRRNMCDETHIWERCDAKYPSNHTPIRTTLKWDDIIGMKFTSDYNTTYGADKLVLNSKGWDFSPRIFNEWPTIEMRLWDSTDNKALLKQRFDLLTALATDACRLQNERGKTALVRSPVSGWVEQRVESMGAR
jgi:hypothetical protein